MFDSSKSYFKISSKSEEPQCSKWNHYSADWI